MFTDKGSGFSDETIRALREKSYVVHLNNNNGKNNVLPVGHCGLLGVALLNYFGIDDETMSEKAREEARGEARLSVARAIAALSGRTGDDEIKEIARKIQEEGLLKFSGSLLVDIRPIDTNEIDEFHKREAEVLRAA
jgi:hypothetical protein